MSDYITAEQFLKQSEKIQNSLRKWLSINPKWIPTEITETQLRHFIEEKTNRLCEVHNVASGRYVCLENENLTSNEIESRCNDDLLQAYWQVAIKIIEDGE